MVKLYFNVDWINVDFLKPFDSTVYVMSNIESAEGCCCCCCQKLMNNAEEKLWDLLLLLLSQSIKSRCEKLLMSIGFRHNNGDLSVYIWSEFASSECLQLLKGSGCSTPGCCG